MNALFCLFKNMSLEKFKNPRERIRNFEGGSFVKTAELAIHFI